MILSFLFQTFRINQFVFKDTLSFQGASLDKLVQDIHERKPNYDFDILAQAEICEDENGEFSKERFDILKSKKSALPYGM